MGSTPSRTAHPTIAEDRNETYISISSAEFIRSEVPKMALAFDSQLHPQDDLGHDTLMGLQELDSHLAIFEETAAPASLSDISSDDFRDSTDLTSGTQFNEAHNNEFLPKVEAVPMSSKVIEAIEVSKYAHPTLSNWPSDQF
jgi:hypothetical protein